MLALSKKNKHSDYPRHCSPCFLVAKPGSTAMRLVVGYSEVNKKTQNHSGSILNMNNTLERIAKCRFKTKMDKRSGFWQVHLAGAAQELLALKPLKAVSSAGGSCPSVLRTPCSLSGADE